MSMWLHINWNQQKLENWKRIRAKGKRDYVTRNGFKVCIPVLVGFLIIAFILRIVKGRFEESAFWIWLFSYIVIAVVSSFGGINWKWDETEKQYREHIASK
ncbi:hypothetical protein PN836_002380 [Ningiella sp. W23]|uniref:hypothetical protein n=1 Tax=Ningiella sp. W23 TaxID=3023715 RepID=UPI003758223B